MAWCTNLYSSFQSLYRFSHCILDKFCGSAIIHCWCSSCTYITHLYGMSQLLMYYSFCTSQVDNDPRNPSYILTQGPLQHTVSSFWQMVWDENCNTIVMLTSLAENNRTLCHQYWPSEGRLTYGNFEVSEPLKRNICVNLTYACMLCLWHIYIQWLTRHCWGFLIEYAHFVFVL